MANKKPEQGPEGKMPLTPPGEGPELDALEGESSLTEDAVISRSFQSLPSVEAPPGFLPNVMFQVYEYHHREKIKWSQVILVTLLLSILSLAFFVADVQSFAEENNLSSFDKALSLKIDHFLGRADKFYAAFSGLLGASWQMVSGVTREWIGGASPVALTIGLVLLVLIAVALRKALIFLRG